MVWEKNCQILGNQVSWQNKAQSFRRYQCFIEIIWYILKTAIWSYKVKPNNHILLQWKGNKIIKNWSTPTTEQLSL